MNNEEIKELIKIRRIQILTNSYLYYEKGITIVSDYKFDEWSNELVKLQIDFPELSKDVIYHDEFLGFDGCSGFDLNYNQPIIVTMANVLVEIHKKRK